MTQAHPKISELLRSGSDGQLFAPVRIEPWSIIVQRESMQSAIFDEKMRTIMTQELFDIWVHEELQREILKN